MLVHPFGDPGWICLERSLSHVDEPVLAQQCSSHEGPTHAVEKVLEDLGADGVRVERRTGEPPLARRQNHAAGGRHRGHGIAMGHDEPGFRVVRGELWQQEKIVRELQQPMVGRPVRVEKAKDALVVGKGISVIGCSPPCRIGGDGEHHLAVVEAHLEDRSVLDWSVHPPNVLGIGLVGWLQPTDVGAFRGEVGRRDRCFHLPLAEVAKPGVEREHVVQRRGSCTGQAKDHEWARDGISRFGPVTGVPVLNAETPAETGDEKGFDPIDGSAVLTDILLDRFDQAGQAVVPVTRSEIGQSGLCTRHARGAGRRRRSWSTILAGS